MAKRKTFASEEISEVKLHLYGTLEEEVLGSLNDRDGVVDLGRSCDRFHMRGPFSYAWALQAARLQAIFVGPAFTEAHCARNPIVILLCCVREWFSIRLSVAHKAMKTFTSTMPCEVSFMPTKLTFSMSETMFIWIPSQ